jgi:hypothetical protein
LNSIRKITPYLGVLILIAAIYDGYVFYSRWSARNQAAEAKAQIEAANRKRAVDALGGGGMKIISFYAAPGTIRRGEKTDLCYAVTGAKTVKLEPAVDEVWPALTRCVKASPKHDTEYTFTAVDEAGHTATETIAVRVR